MPKLYFKYGAMGSSKTAQALMCKFNYEQKGYKVCLLKPYIDKRDTVAGEIVAQSRIGLSSSCATFVPTEDLFERIKNDGFFGCNCVVIVDECQFLTSDQVEQLKRVTHYVPVLCYGLMTNFKTELFEGSKRLVEIADSLMEIKSVCRCGRKANINAKFIDGVLQTDGDEICIGGDETYEGMCYNCYEKYKIEGKKR
jgi:thymidine kinase